MHIEIGKRVRKDNDQTEPYIKSDIKVGCRCILCGYEWEAFPGNLLKGKGCPNWRNHSL